MTLRDLHARLARTTLTQLAHLGEEVTYFFKDGRPARICRAKVTRLGRQQTEGIATNIVRTYRVWLPRTGAAGVAAVQEGDEILLGGMTRRLRVSQILSENSARFLLEVHE